MKAHYGIQSCTYSAFVVYEWELQWLQSLAKEKPNDEFLTIFMNNSLPSPHSSDWELDSKEDVLASFLDDNIEPQENRIFSENEASQILRVIINLYHSENLSHPQFPEFRENLRKELSSI